MHYNQSMALHPDIDIEEASIGGDVADLFGNLERLDTKERYYDSMNPNGDPFTGMKSAKEMIGAFARIHPNDLDILDQRLDNFYGMGEEASQNDAPETYLEAKSAIEEIREKKKEAVAEKSFLGAIELTLLPTSEDPKQEAVRKGMRLDGLQYLGADENIKFLDKYLSEGKMREKLIDLLMDNFENNLEAFDKPERFHNPLGFTIVQSIYAGLGLEHAETDAGKRIYRLAYARSDDPDVKKAVGILKTLPGCEYFSKRF